jgi:hypothetical protein
MGRSPGQAGAPQALRAAGLETALPAAELTPDIILPAPTSARGPADFISGCRGCSIGVYNADLDSGGHAAARIVAFAAGVAAPCPARVSTRRTDPRGPEDQQADFADLVQDGFSGDSPMGVAQAIRRG